MRWVAGALLLAIAFVTAAYEAYIGRAIDRSSGLSVKAFYDRVNEILLSLHADGTLPSWSEGFRGLHADGTLRDLSLEFFGEDYATAAGAFDFSTIEQGL